ncbi:hypothetical protein DFH28DRAFT_963110 [Melampsora americana]|nr:hypothetical protein DFH28DRAFT_963110 [Melampsora americana]
MQESIDNYNFSEKVEVGIPSSGEIKKFTQFQRHVAMDPEICLPGIAKSKDRKRKMVQNLRKEHFYGSPILDGARLSGSNTADLTQRVKDRSDIPLGEGSKTNSDLIKDVAHDAVGKGLLKGVQISPILSNCISRTRNNSESGIYLVTLRKIGMLHSSRSPNLCYEPYEYFCKIHNRIESQNKLSVEEIEGIRLAIKNANVVVMAFLGILIVFEGETYGMKDMDNLLNDGWRFMKNFYSEWETVELKDCGFEKSVQYYSRGAFDPNFHLRYLKQIRGVNKIPLPLVHSICLLWSKGRVQSKIPQDLSKYWHQITNTYNHDSKSIKGGLYERIGIKNYSFWGPEQFFRSKWYLYGDGKGVSHRIWMLASNSAQFHTNVGRHICEELHIFFEDLIQKLQISYNHFDQFHDSQNMSPGAQVVSSESHPTNFALVVKAVSMAEYRVVVPFIGMIRILNQEDLEEEQLQKLMESAISFLKENFGRWDYLDFHPNNIQNLLCYTSNTIKDFNVLNDPIKMFKLLSGFADKNGFPSQAILCLLDSWHKSVITSQPGSERYIGFPIKDIPILSSIEWNSYLTRMMPQDCIKR